MGYCWTYAVSNLHRCLPDWPKHTSEGRDELVEIKIRAAWALWKLQAPHTNHRISHLIIAIYFFCCCFLTSLYRLLSMQICFARFSLLLCQSYCLKYIYTSERRQLYSTTFTHTSDLMEQINQNFYQKWIM